MSFISDTHNAIAKSINQYLKCDGSEQTILRTLAVINKRIGQIKFKKVLSELSHSDVFYRQKLQTLFTPELKEKLVARGLIDLGREGIKISDYLADYLTRICIEQDSFEEIIETAESVVPIEPQYSWSEPALCDRERQVRDCFYRKQYNRCVELLEFNKNPQHFDQVNNEILVSLCFYPFNKQLFSTLPSVMQYQAFATLLHKLRRDLIDNSQVIALLELSYDVSDGNDQLRLLLAEQYLLTGDLNRACALLTANDSSTYGLQLAGCYQFLAGQPAAACESFKLAIVAKNRIARRKKQYIGGIPGLFYMMALLQLGSDADPSKLAIALTQVDYLSDDYRVENNYRVSFMMFARLAQLLTGKLQDFSLGAAPFFHHSNYYSRIEVLVSCLCSHWANERPGEVYLKQLVECYEQLSSCNDRLFAQVAATLLGHFGVKHQGGEDFLTSCSPDSLDIASLITRKEAWALALEQLIALDQKKNKPEQTTAAIKESRLIWLLDSQRYGSSFEAKEQKLGKKGWSKGRTVALKRLYEDSDSFDYLTANDIKMCQAIRTGYSGGYYGRDYFELTGYNALKAAVGLPNLYLASDPEHQLTIAESEPELEVTQSKNGYLLSMANIPSNFEDGESSYSLTPENGHRYRLVRYENRHLEIASIVGEGGLVVPKAAKDKVLQSISAIAPMLNIQSDLDGIDTGIEQIVADKRLYINIQPAGEGLEFECHVQPLGPDGPALSPGIGNPTFSTEINGQRLGTTRDLGQEQLQLQLLAQQCPAFELMIDNRLLSDRLDDALTGLEQLELVVSHSDESANNINKKPLNGPDNQLEIVLQWPKGKNFKLSKKLGSAQMQLAMTKQKEWFGLEGTLTVSDEQVIGLKQLLSLIGQSNGRFVQLDDNQILSLTDELRQRLQDLERATEQGKFHLLASPLVEVATQGMRLKTNHAWDKQRRLLQQAGELTPQLPSTLQAQLRDYQIDGFDWASRLAHWGAGACLADDMGLGKTLQALAVILARAGDGPTLVLAPTSVCFNWQEEAVRFAPTLKVKIFGVDTNSIEQRQLMLDGARAFDVIVCSYGLLQREGERLAKVKWHTIIADEAQALKNPMAKRTQAAMALSGQFKMITTGTPIENNLTELWSLFRFINPGLLGSQKQFHQRFANTIESTKVSDDASIKRANMALRKLISPFILRRMKNQVLTELPPRTEINIHVELSEAEIVLYEALRRQAVENLAKGDETQGPHHIKMLAEIMRLRRVCCHPSLVMPDSGIEGSKLKAFDGLIDELKQNNHKALVFSQFVGHLEILREHLDRTGVSYQYLDGSTPARQRRDAVNSFQAGQGDVFLISLKAGGSGLNLTAADYVIHMDPWWNPAVEDQASDRAHRMGQTRPVTIYRLIAKNTIEDKILALHQQKRDLANSLLEGSDSAGKMSVADMMALLQSY